eukprot:NODE_956_length_1354_cov_111.451341_g795_i0.p1 GENE.NODE_956_length_1354_cov_111.451341_g795_i0~~NODE_956_length_1354_cov_111.451341_g795_i0.p1  ORF type:complete len:350 (+),score=119.38 NODE_956_length_1354_cov_111.451341_g795_i0:34-1050(+)
MGEYCRINHKEKAVQPPPVVDTHWYYAVQNTQHAELFQQHPRYRGGSLVVESLEGATVVDPEYFTIAERVPGENRLRVRVVDASDVALPTSGMELFVRLRLGTGIQFTQPRTVTGTQVAWHQDFLFVSVPVASHPSFGQYMVSSHPLVIEAVTRQVGAAPEQVIASGSVDLTDLVTGLTRVVMIALNQGGNIHVRIKALDFGLPNQPDVVQAPQHQQQQIAYKVSDLEAARRLDAADGVIDGRYNGGNVRIQQHSNTSYKVGDRETAARLDAADGVIDGKYGDAQIRVSNAPMLGQRTSYKVSDREAAARLDAMDGKIDGQYEGAQIRVAQRRPSPVM